MRAEIAQQGRAVVLGFASFCFLFGGYASVVAGQDSISIDLGPLLPTPGGTVNLGKVNPDVRRLSSLDISPPIIRLDRLNDKYQIHVTATLSDGSAYDVTSAVSRTTYTIDNLNVAFVDSEGLLTAVGTGRTILTANHYGGQSKAIVTVDIAESTVTIRVS